MNKFLGLYFVLILGCIGDIFSAYSGNCQFYNDPFGPLKTGRTMGDLVRYAITPGINILNGLVIPPVGAQDIYTYGKNTLNLYNGIGYLYAGWAVLNYRMPQANNASAVNNQHNQFFQLSMNDVVENWITAYRANGGGIFSSNPQKALTDLENNANCNRTILFPTTTPLNYIYYTTYNAVVGDDNAAITAVNSAQGAELISESCGWCSNQSQEMQNSILAVLDLSGNHYVCPSGQFFGARLPLLLGVVVNDVPWSDDPSSSGATGGTTSPTPAFTSPLISGPNGTGTALPMFAVMSGGPWSTPASAPQQMIQPSTAHFGSMQTFINKLSQPTSGWTVSQNYLKNHIFPTVSRLATVASYGISTKTNTTNLIEIQDSNITPSDQGVILAIQNNTGDLLRVNQISAGASTKIGTLQTDINNYFLHTASLMYSAPVSGVTTSTSSGPVATNMISIIDDSATKQINNKNVTDSQGNVYSFQGVKVGTFIQILTGDQFNAIVESVNTKYKTLYPQFANQKVLWNCNQNGLESSLPISSGQSPDTTPYLVIANFDLQDILNSSSTVNYLNPYLLTSFRIQAINLLKFSNQPYFLNIQINKENLSYGISNNVLAQGISNIPFLYPSITSCKLCKWFSLMHQKENQGNYSTIPLLMIPDTVWNSNIRGLQAYYLIWLLSYAAALTECSYNNMQLFGDRLGIYANVFGLFSDQSKAGNVATLQSGYSSQISRIIVDGQGNLTSGQLLQLDNTISIMGCDTWDAGDGFNQDIPILNLATNGADSNGNPIPVANNTGAPFINLSVTFGTLKPQPSVISDSVSELTFSKSYGLPYNNVMMFSLPTQAVQDGVTIDMSQSVAGNYQLVIKSTKDFTDVNNATVKAGSVLGAPKIFVDSEFYDISNVEFDFLHVSGSSAWNSPQLVGSGEVGKTLKFNLKYSSSSSKNSLSIKVYSKPSDFKKDPWNYIFGSANQYSIDAQNQELSYFNFNTNTNKYGFCFIAVPGPWLNNAFATSADLANLLSGKTYFKFGLIGVDVNGNPIFDIQYKNKIDHFEIYLFDQNNKKIGDVVKMNLTDAWPLGSSSVTAKSVLNDIQSNFVLGYLIGSNKVQFIQYPFVLEFKNLSSINFTMNRLNLPSNATLTQFWYLGSFDQGGSSNIGLPEGFIESIRNNIDQGNVLVNIRTVRNPEAKNNYCTFIATVSDVQGNILYGPYQQLMVTNQTKAGGTLIGQRLKSLSFNYFTSDAPSTQKSFNLPAGGQNFDDVWIYVNNSSNPQQPIIPNFTSPAVKAITKVVNQIVWPTKISNNKKNLVVKKIKKPVAHAEKKEKKVMPSKPAVLTKRSTKETKKSSMSPATAAKIRKLEQEITKLEQQSS